MATAPPAPRPPASGAEPLATAPAAVAPASSAPAAVGPAASAPAGPASAATAPATAKPAAHGSPDAAVPDERVKAVRELFTLLRKGVKTIAMYRHSPARFPEFLRPAFQALEALVKAGPLALRVSADAFLSGEDPVWSAETGDNIPGRFYREGIRHLILRPGVTERELTALVMIMLSKTDRGSEEIVSQLFNVSFEHLDYIVVEGFTVGDLSEQQVEAEVDKIVERLNDRLRLAGDDSLAFARDTTDVELKLEGDDQVRSAVLDGKSVAASFKARVQEELRLDDGRLHEQLVGLVLSELAAGRLKDVAVVVDLVVQMLDGMLSHEELAPLGKMLDTLRAAAAKAAQGPVAEVLQRLKPKLGEEQRLHSLGELIKSSPSLDPSGVARYLAELEPQAVEPLLGILEVTERPEMRAILVAALAVLGKSTPAPFVARLNSENWETVRDMIAIIDHAAFPERARYVQQALKNPNPQVRSEVLGTLAHSTAPDTVHAAILAGTTDPAPQVRAAAWRALVQVSPKRSCQDLLRQPRLPDWEKRPLAEKEVVFECLGRSQQDSVLPYLTSLLQQKKTLFTARRILESKLLAVHALASMPNLSSFRVLQTIAAAGNEPEVLTAMRKAMHEVKEALTAGAAKPAGTEEPSAAPPAQPPTAGKDRGK